MLILLLFQCVTNLFGNEIDRLAGLGAAYAGFSALAIVSTMDRMASNQLTIPDEIFVSSFILILVQTFEICVIAIWNFKLFKGFDADKSLVDD